MSRPVLLVVPALLAAACPTPEVTYQADVRPLMEAQCVRCHAGTGPGVGDFTTYENVSAFAGRIQARMDEGSMPPAAADPSCRDYVGSEHITLADGDADLFRRWVELQTPEGKEKDYVAPPALKTELDDPTLEVTMGAAYAPTFADEANPGNEYRCFILDHGQTEPFWITALHPKLGNPDLVHHIVLYALTMDDVPEGYDPEKGMDCIDGRGIDVEGDPLSDGMITGWAPGMLPIEYDVGDTVKGLKINPDQKIVAQMHYYLPGPDHVGKTDQSGFQFRTVTSKDEVDVQLRMANLGTDGRAIQIPAKSTWTYDWDYTIGALEAGTIYATFPHMHQLGTAWNLEIEHADGSTECISRGDRWDFDNQLSYQLIEPVRVNNGDTLRLSCSYDNPTDDVVTGGERTDEEMCYVFIQAEINILK